MSTEQKNVKACGFVVPYKIGGTALGNGQPVLLIPDGENGPVPKTRTGPLSPKERSAMIERENLASSDPACEWYHVGPVTVAGAAFDLYTTHGGKQVGSAGDMIEDILGDAFARASKEEATRLAQQAVASTLDKTMRELIARNPALASVSKSDLLAMILGG